MDIGIKDIIERPDPIFTIVHINSRANKMAMGLSVIQAPTIESALQKLQIAASNKSEKTEPICAFVGRCENLLTLQNSSMRPTQPLSKQIEVSSEEKFQICSHCQEINAKTTTRCTSCGRVL